MKERNFIACDCGIIHMDTVEEVCAKMPDAARLIKLSDLYKSFADGTRLRILWALSIREMCVCDLAATLKMTKSAVSHQLKTLRVSDLVRFRKEGKVVYYSLADSHVIRMLSDGFDHVNE